MTSGPSDGDDLRPVDLSKDDSASSDSAQAPFDPYRFGKPDVPPSPEYAPPGYVPEATPAPPPGGAYPPMPPVGQYPGPSAPPPYQGYGPQYGQYGPGYGPPPQPGGAPYGQPYAMPPYAPGAYPGYAAAQGNGKAIAGMVLGILSIVFCWLTFLDLLLIVPGVVFSLLGLSASKQRGRGRGQAIAGLACTVVGLVLAVVVTVLAFHLVSKCDGIDHSSPAYDRCIRNNL